MTSPLSNLVNSLVKDFIEGKKCETCGIKYKYWDCFLEYTNFKDDLIEYHWLSCSKLSQRQLDEKLKERFFNTYIFSNHNNNKTILLLWKGVYPKEYMDDWKKLNETSLPEKEDFYSCLNIEDITDADYAHAKRVCKDFETKNLGEYHDLYVKSNPFVLADILENFRNMCLEIYELDPAKFLSAPGLA